MRKLVLFAVAILYVVFIASNAFAASLYKAGNISVGAGYATSSYNISGTGTGSGFMGQLSYFIMDDLSIGGQYYTSTFNGGGVVGNVTETIIDVNIGSSLALTICLACMRNSVMAAVLSHSQHPHRQLQVAVS